MRMYVCAMMALLALGGTANAGSIAEHAVHPMTEKGYPKTYKAWGKSGIDKINSLMQPGAELIAASRGCDVLEHISLSESRSTPKSKIVFFGDCKNGQRFYVSEEEIVARQKIVSQDSKSDAVSDSTLLSACQDAIRARLNFPSTFDPGWFGTSVYRAQAGRVVATVEFEAKNALGAKLPHTGKCYMDGGAMTSVEISPR